MRGIIPQPLGQMREYAGHLSRQSILDFSLSSCACSLWHSPPLHSDLSWLNRLFYFQNSLDDLVMHATKKRKVACWGFPMLHFFSSNGTDKWKMIYHSGCLLDCAVVFPKNFVTSWAWIQVAQPVLWYKMSVKKKINQKYLFHSWTSSVM